MFVYCCQQECDGINYSANIYMLCITCASYMYYAISKESSIVELCMLSMLMGLTINATTYI